jgi:hypothetical protein
VPNDAGNFYVTLSDNSLAETTSRQSLRAKIDSACEQRLRQTENTEINNLTRSADENTTAIILNIGKSRKIVGAINCAKLGYH